MLKSPRFKGKVGMCPNLLQVAWGWPEDQTN